MLPKDTQLVSAEAGTEAQIPKPMQRGFFSLPHPNHPMSFLPLPSPQYPGPPWVFTPSVLTQCVGTCHKCLFFSVPYPQVTFL